MQSLAERGPWLTLAKARWVLAVCMLLPALVHGHARLAGSEPADGAVLEQLPAAVLLTFSEPVRPASLQLLDLSGVRAPAALEPDLAGPQVIAALPDGLPPGRYLVEYRVLAADGHAVRGKLGFTLATAPPGAVAGAEPVVGDVLPPRPGPPEAIDPALAEPAVAAPATAPPADYRLLAWAARAGFLLSLLLAAGQALFCGLLPVPEPLAAQTRRAISLLALGGLAAAALLLQTTGLLLLGSTGPLDLAAWRLAASSSVGLSLSLAVPGFLLLALGARNRGAGLLFGGAALLLLSRALTGHPASREPGWLLMPAMILHAGCAAWWYGSLWPLRRALADQPPGAAAQLVERFSILALAAVALLAFAGLMMALVHLAVPAALAGTDYGRLLLGKLALFALLLALAAWHRLALTPRLAQGDPAARHLLRAGITLELAVMTLLLLLSAALTGSAPELPDGGFWR
jgi:copper transport protein